ncbi:MAG: sulfotransferase family protein [Waterburya sp.]
MKTNISAIADPIFIVASGRSGSTHLRLMLDLHPQLTCLDEIDYTVQLISDNGEFPQLDQYHEWLESDRIFTDRKLTIDRQLNYPQLVNSFLAQEQARYGKNLLCAVSHKNFDKLLKIWPNARFIHLVRDGRDVAYSCIAEMGWYGNFWRGVEYWEKSEQLWTTLEKVIPANQKIEITYESFMSKTVETLTQVCNFIGITYNPKMLTYPQTTTYTLPDPSFIGQGRYKMSEYEIRLVESRIAEMLVLRGYKLSGLPLLNVNATMQRWLRLQDWWKRIQLRIEKYSLPLFLSDYLSRNFGFPNWQKSIKLQLNAIENADLK